MSGELKNVSTPPPDQMGASPSSDSPTTGSLSASKLTTGKPDLLTNPDPVRIPRGFLEAQREIRARLQTHLRSATNSAIEQAWLLSDKTHNLELLDKLPKLTATDRKELLTEIVDLACKPGVVGKHVRLKLPFVFRDLPIEERRHFVRKILAKDPLKQADCQTISEILKASQNIEELQETLAKIKKRPLLSVDHKELRECIAISLVYSKIQISDSDRDAFMASSRRLGNLKELIDGERGLSARLENVASQYPHFKSTQIYKDYHRILDEALKGICRPKFEAGFLFDKLDTCLQHRCVFIDGHDRKTGLAIVWNQQRLKQARLAINQELESEPLFIARATEYRLRDMCEDKETVAHRVDLGRIQITPGAFKDSVESNLYAGLPSGTTVLLHEKSHELQVGTYPGPKKVNIPNIIRISGEPSWDFHEFAQINDWEAHSGKKVKQSKNDAMAKILEEDGSWRKVILGVRDNQTGRTFTFDDSPPAFYSYGVNGEFAIDQADRKSPFEDFAVKRTSYMAGLLLKSNRADEYLREFIERCPQAFLFFERRERRYGDHPEYREFANQAIEAKEEAARIRNAPKVIIERVYEKTTLDKEEIQSVHDYFKSRFRRLRYEEQNWILATLRNEALEVDGHLNKKLEGISNDFSKSGRNLQFRQLMELRVDGQDAGPPLIPTEKLVSTIKEAHKDYFPTLLYLERAIREGHDIGILTGRSTRLTAQMLVGRVKDFLNYEIPGELTYCVNDRSRNARLQAISTDGRKAEVILDRVRGYRIDVNGNHKEFDDKYDIVILIDDEQRNLDTAKEHADKNGIGARVITIQAQGLSIENEIDLSLNLITSGPTRQAGSPKVLVLTDIDGTVCHVKAVAHIRTDEGPDKNRSLFTFTQQDVAEYPRDKFVRAEDFMLETAKLNYPELDSSKFRIDWDDFGDSHRTIKLIREQGEILYRPRVE